MKHKFTLGMVAGISALGLAVPTIATIAGAQSVSSVSSVSAVTDKFFTRAEFKQPSLEDMIKRDEDFLKNVDTIVTLQKSATQVHLNALKAAATLTDEAAKQAAVKAANEAHREALHTAIEANTDLKSAMMPMMFGGAHGEIRLKHRGPGDIAEKLGMTPEELKTAIESGKTIEEIATEKGVTLPARPKFMMRMKGGAPVEVQAQ